MAGRRNVLTSAMLSVERADGISLPAAIYTLEQAELLHSRRCIASIDLDCFYAQCEELREPALKGALCCTDTRAYSMSSYV